MTEKKQIEEIKALFQKHEIKRVKLGGTDLDGVLRGKFISLEKFWSVVNGGMGFCDVVFGWDMMDELYDKPTVTGWHTGYPDAPAKVDLGTFRTIPWEPNTAAFLLDFEDQHGQANPVSPRQILKKIITKAETMGFEPFTATEFEFFIYDETPKTLHDKGFLNAETLDTGMFGYSWLRTSQCSALTQTLLDDLSDFGVPLEGFHTETGPGVFEAAIQYDKALLSADRAILFKTAVKEICHRFETMASFMAKPSNKLPGCSGHQHQSLWNIEDGNNAFYDENDPQKISNTLRHYVAGQLKLMPEFCALIAPTINSYKRLVPGLWAPTRANWGIENRTCALRVIPGSSKATRVEYRVSGADINPYIAAAASIASGLYGIENKLELPDAISGNGYDDTISAELPRTLRDAGQALDKSTVAREIFGDTFVDHYVLTRDWECRQAEAAVTDWELARYFELV
ncbi:MAG: glutamine synthetase [Myxococcota bacterium]|nr:glutamine synthetase [Myxococcota bacterium]